MLVVKEMVEWKRLEGRHGNQSTTVNITQPQMTASLKRRQTWTSPLPDVSSYISEADPA